MSIISKKTIELVLYTCLGYKENETVLVVTDETLWDLGLSFYKGLRDLGIEAILNSMKPRAIHGEEPPATIAEAMKNVDIALLITSKSLSHTQARRLASASSRKVRIASMPGADSSRLDRLLNINYDEMLRHSLALSELLKKTKKVEIRTSAGTQISMEIQGRTPHIDCGILTAPMAFGNLPAGEVYLAPLEGTTNGILVLDGSMAGIGRLTKPIKVTVKNGMVVKTNSPELNKILEPLNKSARNIAELGIGINPNAEIVGNILEDEKALNTVHIAFGDNLSMGGKIKAPCHLDGIILSPSIKLDGKFLPERLLKWYPSVKKESIKHGIIDTTYSVFEFEEIRSTFGSELYKMLFENSNDPQYVLDIKSQVFLEANPAFLSLAGYKREELVGRLKSNDLTTAKAHPILLKKKEALEKGIEQERYEFQVLTKSGEAKPVELSVRRMKLVDREVTIGSARDISERLKLENALREKITELALAGNRLMSLTEKIKNVPILIAELLKSHSEEVLYQQTIKLLCDPTGLNYKEVAIYLVKDNQLKLTQCNSDMLTKSINLNSSHRFARILRGELTATSKDSEILLPLKGLKQNFGLIKVIPEPKEKELMDTNPMAQKSYRDVLETIVSILGLLIESIRLNKTLEIQSIIDELTQVHNRRYFDVILKEEVERSMRYKHPLSLFLLDLDDFKDINDTAGHKQGDAILAEVARLLKKYSRKVDSVCRYGGEEFTIILPETALSGAQTKAHVIYDKIKKHAFSNIKSRGKSFHLTLSIGISTLSKEKGITSDDTLLTFADKALYEAKKLKGTKEKHIKAL